MQTHATMYCKYYQLQVLYTLFSPILGQVIMQVGRAINTAKLQLCVLKQ